jgi:GINS complex subunit 2
MSGLTLKCLNSAENEFLAEDELITIVSNFDHAEFQFLSGNFGPLESGLPCTVPLWLAVLLRKRGKCTIQAPGWMTVEFLERAVAEEPRNNGALGEIPFHYMEISQLILSNAKGDVKGGEQVALLLQDLENIRMDRIRLGIQDVAKSTHDLSPIGKAQLNNVGSLEIFTIKRVFLGAMEAFYKLNPPAAFDNAGDDGGVQTKGTRRRFRNT